MSQFLLEPPYLTIVPRFSSLHDCWEGSVFTITSMKPKYVAYDLRATNNVGIVDFRQQQQNSY